MSLNKTVIDLGLLSFTEADQKQRELVVRRLRGEIPDTLILVEHPPVFTMGRRPAGEDLKVPLSFLKEKGVPLIQTDRGGKITYHGPGQLVAWFVFSLGQKTIPQFVREVEEILIRLLRSYEIAAERDPQYPGVWVEKRKIAALGLHFEKGVSRHGLALNISCDLEPFEWIHPCGIQDRGVTSFLQEKRPRPVGTAPSLKEVKERLQLEIFSSSL